MAQRPEASESDIVLATQIDNDHNHERAMLEKAQSDAFWGPFSLLGQLSQPTCTLLQEWVISKVNNGTSTTEFETEGPELARQFCIGLLTLLSRASPTSTPEQTAGVDIALIIMDTICTETPEYLQVFRDYAQEAYLDAKKNPLYLAQLLQAKRYLEAEKAKEDAFKTEVQLSYHRAQTSPSQSSPAYAFDGEMDGQPLSFPAKDLPQYGHIHDNNMYTSLHQLLNLHGATPFQQRKAVRIICTLLSKNVHENHPIHQYIFNFLTSSLPHTMGHGIISLLDGLRILLTNKKLHYTFITHNGIKVLKQILTTSDNTRTTNIQALYFAGYCVWLLSYNPDNDCYLEQWSMVETLVSLLRTITRDKIVRISLLTFVNLLPRRDFVTLLIGAQFHKLISVIQQRKWADKDVITDLSTLQQALQQRLSDLSTFDQYLAEIRSGSLKKTPVHTERFWRDNASKFDTADPNEEFLRKLISFVTNPQSTNECLEMAAYDLGEFARFHPDGKKILSRLGAKLPLMELMKHADQAVAKAALLATQKLLIHRWDEMLQSNKAQGLKA